MTRTGRPRRRSVADVADSLSGPAGGTISYRRAEGKDFTDLPIKLHQDGGKSMLVAPMPDLPAGTWVFRAEASDAAGNAASTSLRADGTQMSIHVKPADPGAGKGGAVARLVGRRAPAPRAARRRDGPRPGSSRDCAAATARATR